MSQGGGSQQPEKKSTAASKAANSSGAGEEEDSWAEWLANEASVSVVSPDGEKGSLRAVPEEANELAANNNNSSSSSSNRRVDDGEQVLPPTRSFRGLGAALKTIKSFRDGRDKSQVRR